MKVSELNFGYEKKMSICRQAILKNDLLIIFKISKHAMSLDLYKYFMYVSGHNLSYSQKSRCEMETIQTTVKILTTSTFAPT